MTVETLYPKKGNKSDFEDSINKFTILGWEEIYIHRNKEYLGSMECAVLGEPLMAGMPGTIQVTYTVGAYGIDDGGAIYILRQGVTDWQPIQTTHPSEFGYTTAKSTGNVRLEVETADGIRPYENAIRVRIRDGCLKQGDTIQVILGDTSQGSAGLLTQTVAEKNHKIIVAVDPFNCNRYEEVHPIAFLPVLPGAPAKVEIILPSTVKCGEEFWAKVRVIDMYGNACEDFSDEVLLEQPEGLELGEKTVSFAPEDRGSRFVSVVCNEEGIYRLTGNQPRYNIQANSNVCIGKKELEYRLFWGDMHGQNIEASGLGSMEDSLWFARNIGMLDFTGWQGNDFEVSDQNWKNVKDALNAKYVPGEFVTFPGYEWSGITSAGGDHNIYFLNEDEQIHRTSQWVYKDGRTYTGYGREDDGSDCYPITQLWDVFKGRRDVMAIPHVGGRAANFDFYNPEMIKVVEIHSHHGIFDWFQDEAIKRKMKVGFIATSDDHTSRLGLSYPVGTNSDNFGATFDVISGLTAIYAKELTREGIWEAFQARRCYASTNGRTILDFKVNGHMMGEEIDSTTSNTLSLHVDCAAPVDRVELYRDLECLKIFYPISINMDQPVKRVKIAWSGVRSRFRKKSVLWDGSIFVRNGRLVNAENYSIDRDSEGIQNKSNQYVNFRSKTSGDEDGVILDIIPADVNRCQITFASKQTTVTVDLKDLQQIPVEYFVGGENCKVQFSLEPQATEIQPGETFHFDCTLTDEQPADGLNIYYARVYLKDGNRAWSSPVFVNNK